MQSQTSEAYTSDNRNLIRDDWRISINSPYGWTGKKDTEMFENGNTLDLTAKELELIEAALHTQKKILSMQSEAGGTGSRQKLSELKHLMKRIGRSKISKSEPISWQLITRTLFGDVHTANQSR